MMEQKMKVPTRLPPFTTKAEIFAIEEATKMMKVEGQDMTPAEYKQFEMVVSAILKGIVWSREHTQHAIKYTGF